ncbi:MAG: RecX family transcriptional regulator [Thermoanaerobaculia bacterium]|mgnify:CR=1 FL=1|nr:RecX family transcriptional regulator [Thermoanaerobaculia bacterium]
MSAWKRSKTGGGDEAAEAAERASAGEKAAQLLALRPHFRRELELKLGRAGYERGEIAEALDKLARLRLLDDGALARSFVETVARRKGWGRMRVAQELARRGAPEEAAEAALAGLSSEADLEAARDAARRWQRRGAGKSDALARHLSRRGFASSAIFKVLKEMAPSASDEEEAPAAEE